MKLLKPWFGPDDSLELSGKRVTLRTPVIDDFQEWRDLRINSKAFLEPWEPTWDERELSRANFRMRLGQYRAMQNADQAYPFLIYTGATQQMCGGITLSNVRRGIAQTGTLGYWIGAQFARQGLMTEAVFTLLDHALGNLDLHRIEAGCLPSNLASVGLLKRCGFAQEGLAKSYLKIAGQWQDHLLFAKIGT